MGGPSIIDLRHSEALDGVVTLTIDRPRQLNAMTSRFFEQLPGVMSGLASDERCRALVLTGAGDHFSAGGDMNSFLALDSASAHRQHMERAFAALSSVSSFPKPIVAAVEGVAYAGGLEIASACDIVVAGTGARFSLPEVTIGLLPAFGIQHLVRGIGAQRARWLAMTGRPIDASTAGAWGLVDEVTDDGGALARARLIAAELAALPAAAVRAVKSFVARTEATLQEGIDINVQLFGTPEHQAAVREFIDQRNADR